MSKISMPTTTRQPAVVTSLVPGPSSQSCWPSLLIPSSWSTMLQSFQSSSRMKSVCPHSQSRVHGWDLVWRRAVVLLCDFNRSSVMVDLLVIVVPDDNIILSLSSPPPHCGQPTSVNPFKCWCADKMPTGQNANQRLAFCPDLFLWLAFCLSQLFGWHFVRTISTCFGILSKSWKSPPPLCC